MVAKKTALIAGSTGLVGRELLILLVEDPAYDKIIALVRKKNSYKHAKLVQVETDFNRLDESSDYFRNVNDVFCCLGTTMKNAGSKEAFIRVDYEYPVALAELAEKNSCEGFYCISSMGADPKSRVFYNRVKGQLEAKIKSLKIPSIYIFRPSLLIGYREEVRIGERIAIAIFRALAFIFWGPLKNLKGITSVKVANAMIQAAGQKEPGVHILLSGEMQESSGE
jgi:uncharacterized protein YbjT (DUF2867 family)